MARCHGVYNFTLLLEIVRGVSSGPGEQKTSRRFGQQLGESGSFSVITGEFRLMAIEGKPLVIVDGSCAEDVQTILCERSGLIEANDIELSPHVDSVVQHNQQVARTGRMNATYF